MRFFAAVLGVGSLLVASMAAADTYVVKPDGTGDFKTIQDAVKAAKPGDIIELADGEFTGEGNRDIVVDKGITIQSQSGDADLCTIDCTGDSTDVHLGFAFGAGPFKDQAALLQNVTIKKGFSQFGGAILCAGSSPAIRGCKIVENTAFLAGGGIASLYGSPTITECTIAGNTGLYTGGGAYFYGLSAPKIEECSIVKNRVGVKTGPIEEAGYEGPDWDQISEWIPGWDGTRDRQFLPGGAGVASVNSCSPAIAASEIRENVIALSPVLPYGMGAGILCAFMGNPTITNCRILDNRVEISEVEKQTWIVWGAGAFFVETTPRVEGCTIARNLGFPLEDNSLGIMAGLPCEGSSVEEIGACLAQLRGTIALGGGVCCACSLFQIVDCAIADNVAHVGGGVCLGALGLATVDTKAGFEQTITGCTIVKNAAYVGGGLCVSEPESRLRIGNCTISGNAAYEAGGVYSGPIFAAEDLEFWPQGLGGEGLSLDRSPDRAGGLPGDIGPLGIAFLENTILWGNCSLVPEGEEAYFDLPAEFACCDVDSPGVSGPAPVTYGPGNIFVDPMFCSPVDCKEVWDTWPFEPDADFRIAEESPCAPENSPTCGLIGALGVCGPGGPWYVATYGNDYTGDGSLENPFGTIQHGINRARPGEMVIVLCGTYYERDMLMKSGIHLTSETGQADCVTVDAQEQCYVFHCSGLDESTTIEGLTITGGTEGGMFCGDSFVKIRNCIFIGNSIDVHGAGGLYCYRGAPELNNCVFAANTARYNGGGMHCYQSSTKILGCIFVDNTADYDGGGLYCYESSPELLACRFYGNSADDGGGLDCEKSSPTITECIFADNIATNTGGGLYCYYDSSPIVRHCTFYGNWARFGGGIYSWHRSAPTVENTIVAFSTEGRGVRCMDEESVPGLTCCDIYGNCRGDWLGYIADQFSVNGNFCEDPLFCDPAGGDFRIDDTSPCAPANSPPGCGLIGALPPGCVVVSVGAADMTRTEGLYLAPNVPNPFNPSTEVTFGIPAASDPSRVTLTVYNSLGQRVRTLADEDLSSGLYTVIWDGTDENGVSVASGVYFCNLCWQGRSETQRMVLLK